MEYTFQGQLSPSHFLGAWCTINCDQALFLVQIKPFDHKGIGNYYAGQREGGSKEKISLDKIFDDPTIKKSIIFVSLPNHKYQLKITTHIPG